MKKFFCDLREVGNIYIHSLFECPMSLREVKWLWSQRILFLFSLEESCRPTKWKGVFSGWLFSRSRAQQESFSRVPLCVQLLLVYRLWPWSCSWTSFYMAKESSVHHEAEDGNPRSWSWRLCNGHFVLFAFSLEQNLPQNIHQGENILWLKAVCTMLLQSF